MPSFEKVRELRKQRETKVKEARAIATTADEESRDLTEDEQTKFDAAMDAAGELRKRIEREESLIEAETQVETAPKQESRNREFENVDKPESEVEVDEDRGREARMAENVLKMLTGQVTGQPDLVRRSQHELAREGWYGKEGQQRAAGDYYSTLVSADGAVLLPTQVVSQIEEISEVLGVARGLCTTFNHIVGDLKVPGATGNLRASAVAEGGTISSSMRQFQAITLNPQKWALIVPWTYEISLEAGPQILADAQRAIARGFAHAEDDALFNGDGTSTYNSIDGILSSNRASVATYTMGSGDTSFDDLSTDDVFFVRRELDPAVRNGGTYVFHPDMEPKLRTLQDGNGRYIYAYNSDTQVATLGGRPVRYTEVLPAIGSDGTSTVFGVYGDFSYAKLAIGQGMSSEDLREATVEDADTGANINLATQDMRALKVREFFDLDMNFEEAFVKIGTAAS